MPQDDESGAMSNRERLGILLPQPPENTDWKTVIQVIKSAQPHELVTEDDWYVIQSTFLHEIIPLNPPLEAIQAVLQRIPWAPTTTLNDGRKPLNVACDSGASHEIIRTLLRAQCEDGGLYVPIVLHENRFWTDSFPLELMALFLEELPLDMVNVNIANDCMFNLLQEDYVNHESFWEKLNLVLLKLSMNVTREEELGDRSFNVLHSFLCCLYRSWRYCGFNDDLRLDEPDFNLPVTIRVLDMIKDRNPNQFRTRDDEGMFPLHIALKLYQRALNQENGESNVDPNESDSDSEFIPNCVAQQREISEHSNAIVNYILKEFPAAATECLDAEGTLPLHVAVKHGLTCLDTLAETYPSAVSTPDPVTRLYPFQLAALDGHPYQHPNTTNTVYTLLRRDPHVMRAFRVDDPMLDSKEFLAIQRSKLEMEQLEARQKLEMMQLEARHKFELKQFEARRKTLKRNLYEAFGSSS